MKNTPAYKAHKRPQYLAIAQTTDCISAAMWNFFKKSLISPLDPKWHYYRGADKSLARPDWKKQLKFRHFSSDAEVIAAAETWLERQLSE